jgi:T-complex protein 1 subunit theta
MVLDSQMQELKDCYGTNFNAIFAGSLLEQAEELLRLGISTSEIAEV